VRAARQGVHGFHLGLSVALNAFGRVLGAPAPAVMYRSQSPEWWLVVAIVGLVSVVTLLLYRVPKRMAA